MIVPALVGLRGLDQREAHATALGTTAVATTTAAVAYLTNGGLVGVRSAPEAVITLIVVAPMAASIAARRLPLVSEGTARRAFGTAMILMVPLVVFVGPHHLVLDGWVQIAAMLMAGIIAGSLSGFLGIGSGLLLVPLLLLVAVESQVTAQGISLLAIAPAALVGSIAHRRNGLLHHKVAGILAVGAVVGAVAGARLAHVVDESLLRWLLVAALLLVGAQQLLRNVRPRPLVDVPTSNSIGLPGEEQHR